MISYFRLGNTHTPVITVFSYLSGPPPSIVRSYATGHHVGATSTYTLCQREEVLLLSDSVCRYMDLKGRKRFVAGFDRSGMLAGIWAVKQAVKYPDTRPAKNN